MSTVTMNLDMNEAAPPLDMPNMDQFGLHPDLGELGEINAADMPSLPALGNPFDSDELGQSEPHHSLSSSDQQQDGELLPEDVSDIPLPVLGSSAEWAQQIHSHHGGKPLASVKQELGLDLDIKAEPAPSKPKRARSAAGKRSSPTTPPMPPHPSPSAGNKYCSNNPPASPLGEAPSSPERDSDSSDDCVATPPKAAKKRAGTTAIQARPKMVDVVKADSGGGGSSSPLGSTGPLSNIGAAIAATTGVAAVAAAVGAATSSSDDLESIDFSSSALGPMAYDPKMIEAQRELRLKRNRQAAQQ